MTAFSDISSADYLFLDSNMRRDVERMRRAPAAPGVLTPYACDVVGAGGVVPGLIPGSTRRHERAVHAFIFDVDGVIADTAGRHAAAWRRLAEEEGLRFDRGMADALRGLSRTASLRTLLAGKAIPDEQFAEWMDRKNAYYLQLLEGLSPGDLMPGIERLLKELAASGRLLAAASASRNARMVLSRLEIDDQFDAIVDGIEVTQPKPAPDLFLRAAVRLRTDARTCVVVEDATAGIAAARAAGMRSIGVGDVDRLCAATLAFATLEHVESKIIIETLERVTTV
jgi:kojibiose phosphorylase